VSRQRGPALTRLDVEILRLIPFPIASRLTSENSGLALINSSDLFPELSQIVLDKRSFCRRNIDTTSAASIDRGVRPLPSAPTGIVLRHVLLQRITTRWESCLHVYSRTSRFPLQAWHCSALKSTTWRKGARRCTVASIISDQRTEITPPQNRQPRGRFDWDQERGYRYPMTIRFIQKSISPSK
jgi:hypothetical protein